MPWAFVFRDVIQDSCFLCLVWESLCRSRTLISHDTTMVTCVNIHWQWKTQLEYCNLRRYDKGWEQVEYCNLWRVSCYERILCFCMQWMNDEHTLNPTTWYHMLWLVLERLTMVNLSVEGEDRMLSPALKWALTVKMTLTYEVIHSDLCYVWVVDIELKVV